MIMNSAIYRGDVVHARFRPRRHRMKYRVFSLLLDLDQLENLNRSMRLFGHNRRAMFSFWDKDHGTLESNVSLRDWVESQLRAAGIDPSGGRVHVLCYPRIFGYVFNPLTVYYCSDENGGLNAILYEVCNTFHERHTYVIPASGVEGTVRQSCAKELYVSPFMPMECDYHFQIDPPGDRIAVRINETDVEGPLLYASFEGEREPLSDRALLTAFFNYPLMTLKVMMAIHFEAARLWLKGLRVFKHTPAAETVTASIMTVNGTAKGVENG